MSVDSLTRDGVLFTKACAAHDVPKVGGYCAIMPDGMQIAVFRTEDGFYAVSHTCPHQRYRVMARCHVHANRISCPMHGWTFDIRNGEEIRQRGRIPTFTVLLENETIYVKYNPDAEPSWMK